MKKSNLVKVLISLILVLFLSGCCTTPPPSVTKACGDSYDKIKTDDYALSAKATKRLKKMNKSIAEDNDSEVRLASCTSAMTLIIGRELDNKVSPLCKQEGLSPKEVSDCKQTTCTSHLKSDWCAGLEEEIKGYMDACAQFEFNSQKCVYEAQSK